jgi:hypothetical protein
MAYSAYRTLRSMPVMLVLPLVATFAFPSNGRSPGRQTATIDVQDDGRPLANAIRTLETRYGWVVTYEDPPYRHATEVNDVSKEVFKGWTPDKHRILVPKAGPLSVAYMVPPDGSLPDPPTVLAVVLQQYNASGNPGRFGVRKMGNTFHVVPIAGKGAAGTMEARGSLLDTKISIPSGKRTALEMMQQIRDVLTRTTGLGVSLGTVPVNLLTQVLIDDGADQEDARSVLTRTLAATGARLSWQLFYDPTGSGLYVLNLHGVNDPK